jgi:hypothetical protein
MNDATPPTPTHVTPRTRNYLLRHWRGECSLAVSYWVNGWLAIIPVATIAVLVGIASKEGRQPWLYLSGLLLTWTIVILAVVWQSVGTWRSAARVKRLRGKRFWPVVAQVMTVLGLLSNANLIRIHAVPAISDAEAYVEGDPNLGVHGVRILRGGAEIEVSGPFTWNLAQQLQAVLTRAPTARVVHLDSLGGRVGVALNIADIISAHHLDTYVDHLCASACTLAFLAGRQRWIGERGRLGFHSGTVAGAVNRIANAGFRRWYERDGLPSAFLDHVFRTPSKELWFPTRDELAGAHVTTGLAADGTFAVSGFGPRPNLRDTEQQLLALPIYAALQRADPDWPALMATWDRTVSNGETITGFSLELRTHIARNTRRLLPIAPDSTLRQFAVAMLSETEAIQQADPEACWQSLHNGAIERRRYLSPAQLHDELTTSARLLQDATDHPQPRLSAADSKALLTRLIVAMRHDGQDPDQALTALRSDAPHAAYCPGFEALVRAAMAWSAADGGSPLRALFSSG